MAPHVAKEGVRDEVAQSSARADGESADAEQTENTPVVRRLKETLIPSFDPSSVAADVEASADRPTLPPPFDPMSYARIVDSDSSSAAALRENGSDHGAATAEARDSSRTPRVGAVALAEALAGTASERDTTGTIGRAMYGSYLASDYPAAMNLAERVLDREPGHALARLVLEACQARLGTQSSAPRLLPSSVVRLKRPLSEITTFGSDHASQVVLGVIDGVVDVAMVAELSGVSRPEAMDRLYALLQAGMLEVVNE